MFQEEGKIKRAIIPNTLISRGFGRLSKTYYKYTNKKERTQAYAPLLTKINLKFSSFSLSNPAVSLSTFE